MNKERIKALMEYLRKEFPGCIEDQFTYDMIVNLINYAYKTHGHSKGSAKYVICSILPEVDCEELEAYLPDFKEE